MFENTHTHTSQSTSDDFKSSYSLCPQSDLIHTSSAFGFFSLFLFFFPSLSSLPVVQVAELRVRRSTVQNVVQRGEEAPASKEEGGEVEKKIPQRTKKKKKKSPTAPVGTDTCGSALRLRTGCLFFS